jgi:hypothetical protein
MQTSRLANKRDLIYLKNMSIYMVTRSKKKGSVNNSKLFASKGKSRNISNLETRTFQNFCKNLTNSTEYPRPKDVSKTSKTVKNKKLLKKYITKQRSIPKYGKSMASTVEKPGSNIYSKKLQKAEHPTSSIHKKKQLT